MTLSEPSRFIEEIDQSLIEKTRKASFRGATIKEERNYNPFNKSKSSWTSTINESHSGTTATSPAQQRQPVAHNVNMSTADASEIMAGQRVFHQKFGAGTVITVEGAGPNKKASVDFDESGNKMLMLKFAKLSIIN